VLVGSIGGAMSGYDEIRPYTKNINKDNLEIVIPSIDSIFNHTNK